MSGIPAPFCTRLDDLGASLSCLSLLLSGVSYTMPQGWLCFTAAAGVILHGCRDVVKYIYNQVVLN